MQIVTFTRSTPDTAAKVSVDAEGAVTWGDAALVVNPWDEYSLEETIAQAKNAGAGATVVAIGGELHNDALKHAIAMGIGDAVRVEAPADPLPDSLTWATLAAATVNKLDDAQLVICGKESVDVGTDQHIYQMARKLGWTMLGYVSKILEVDTNAGTIRVEKTLEQGKQIIQAPLPAVVTVLKGINEPRYPSFMGIRKASKKKIPLWTAEELGVTLPEAPTQHVSYTNLPEREIVNEIIEGDSAADKAAQLVDKLLEEKVL